MESTVVTINNMDLTDQEIVARVLAGEARLFERIMRKYNTRLYRVARSIVVSDWEVDDLMQCTYVKAYEHLGSFEWRSSFSTWLTRILVNECLAHLKKKRRYMNMHTEALQQDSVVPSQHPTPVAVVMNKELARALEEALFKIPEKYRTVFVMREMEHMSIAETVAALNLTESNVKVRLNRAKSMLQGELQSFYGNEQVMGFYLIRCDALVNKVFLSIGV